MNRAQLAMAYQACEVADLARSAVPLHDPAEAVAHAERVLTAAHQLLTAAQRLAEPSVPTDPLQRFAYDHPDEAAADISDWLHHSSAHDPAVGRVRGGGRGLPPLRRS